MELNNNDMVSKLKEVQIDNYPGYSIREDGEIISYKKSKIGIMLKPQCNTQSYLIISLRNKEGIKSRRIHKIVAEAFLPNPTNHLQLNHIDGDRTNNHYKNIEWCTSKENHIHAWDNDMKKGTPVSQHTLDGKLINTYKTQREASRSTGIIHTSIGFCARGKYKSAGGYLWRYVDSDEIVKKERKIKHMATITSLKTDISILQKENGGLWQTMR